MSIAVSAVVKPSRLLRAVLAFYAAVNLAAAVFLASSASGAFRAPVAIGACCLLAAAGAAHGFTSAGKMRRIDIFGVGEMRLTVQQKLTETAVENEPVALSPGSAVWPGLLMLLMRGEDGKTRVVAVLADSVSAGEFRALAVAIRAIGGQLVPDQVLFGPHKIL
ncbi:MAG TPA: protein YgfX [Telluria sp.]